MTTQPLILLAAGGTGGHLFPAEALGVELIRRGLRVRLATDGRALRYSGLFSKDTIDVVGHAFFLLPLTIVGLVIVIFWHLVDACLIPGQIRRENSIVETTDIADGIDCFSTDDPRSAERAACTPGFTATPAD